jgi:hypothetical protein
MTPSGFRLWGEPGAAVEQLDRALRAGIERAKAAQAAREVPRAR